MVFVLNLQDEQNIYVVQELCCGGDLSDLMSVSSCTGCLQGNASQYGQQARVVAAAHTNSLVCTTDNHLQTTAVIHALLLLSARTVSGP